MKHTRFIATVLMALIVVGVGARAASAQATSQQTRAEGLPAAINPLVRTVDLSIGEVQEVELADGSKARVKLINVQETRDRVRNAVREAKVTVEVNGTSLTLLSATYHLPVTMAGVQIDCPITKGYLVRDSQQNAWALKKGARLRLWPAGSPWIQPGTFAYPVRQRWLVSDTQMANEPCYVNGAELPAQKDIYYHYGLDFGGAEGLVEVVAATEGLVVSAAGQTLPAYKDSPAQPRYDVIYVVDGRGWYYRYSHLMTIEVKPGQRVRMGERIGLLGKEGGSGGWSHLHFDITRRQPSGAWGIQDAYAYAWQAYQQEYRPKILAVARPHQLVTVGEKVVLDGTKSWSAAGKIARCEWTFTDGGTALGSTAERTYERPGTYSEVLKVTDEAGQVAWDFAVVEVQDLSRPDWLPPSIHAAYFPTTNIRPGDAVTFKVRAFRTTEGEERWDFGDGSPSVRVRSDGNANVHAKDGYAVTEHRYARPGSYLVRVERSNGRGEKAVGHVVVDVQDRTEFRTRVSIRQGRWFLNDEITYRGTKAEGLLMNVRTVNAVFEDRTRPDFDPEANTDEFIAQIPDYVAHGVRAFTVCLQGGSTGYEGALNSAFNPDGSLRDSYLHRVQRIIEACDRSGAVVILGCYYQRQDQVLKDEAAVRAGVVNVVKWLGGSGFTNVVLEIANEFGHSGFDHPLLKTPEGIAELIRLAKQTSPTLFVSASGLGSGRLAASVAEASDFLLIHFNSTPIENIPACLTALRKFGKPIVCNEDTKVGGQGAKAAEVCVGNGTSWGFMLVEVNQHFPFTFRGAADDPEVYAAIQRLTSTDGASSPGSGFVGWAVPTSSQGQTKQMVGTAHPTADTRLRLLIETDAGGDPDDEQSLVRFLLYANEWDIEGIIANRPVTRRPENKNPEDSGLAIVRRLLDAYGQCRPNLVQHDARYPTTEFLWQRTVAGYNDTNDAVNLIIAAVDKEDPRPLWYSDWGTDHGAAVNNLKRALDRVLRERGPEGYVRFKSKLRLSSANAFGDHTTTVAPPFPIWVNTFEPPVEGKRWYHRFSGLTSQAGGFDLRRDVLASHGPLGELYPTNTTHWAKEGDTMTFLYLVPTGMNDPNEPLWGSWAGRYGRNETFPGNRYYWANQTDAWNGATSRDNTLARWAADLQNDFHARLDWCVKSPQKANHAPHTVVNGLDGKGILRFTARPGDEVPLDAGLSRDPDGDKLTYEWLIYRETGTYAGEISLANASSSRTALHVPGDAAGKTIHIVLTVRDGGMPPLAAYRRIVVQVSSEPASRTIQPSAAPRGYFPPPESQGGWRMLDGPDEIRTIGGMDPAKLGELKEWLLQSDKRNFAAVVIRRGHIVLEVERGNSAKTDSRRVASVSKAVCATVLAIASEQSQQGLTPKKMTFDDLAFRFIPWAEPLSDPRKAQITVKQLLNHTSGLCPEATGTPNDGTWEYVLGHSGDPRTAKLAFDPGTACGYSSHALHHASLVCETVTGKPYDQFAIEALFSPLGIEHWWFQYFEGGEKIGRHPTHGLGMPARDLARIAYCMLQEGHWGDRQVIPKWFVDQTAACTHSVTSPEMRWKLNPQTFSHGWELPAVRGGVTAGGGIPADARYKPGSGGQLIAFVPSLDLVITRQTGSSGEWAYEEYVRRACAAVLTNSGKRDK
jgi:CubicO group peptidase (beta-lactamase class C family)/murein DD-endopeptidase MepM/ murein hydrolase activator NlpD